MAGLPTILFGRTWRLALATALIARRVWLQAAGTA